MPLSRICQDVSCTTLGVELKTCSLPELAVARLIDFPGTDNGDVAGQGCLHNVSSSIEDSGFSSFSPFQYHRLLGFGVCRSQSCRDLACLDEGIYIVSAESAISTSVMVATYGHRLECRTQEFQRHRPGFALLTSLEDTVRSRSGRSSTSARASCCFPGMRGYTVLSGLTLSMAKVHQLQRRRHC